MGVADNAAGGFDEDEAAVDTLQEASHGVVVADDVEVALALGEDVEAGVEVVVVDYDGVGREVVGALRTEFHEVVLKIDLHNMWGLKLQR